MPFTLQSVPRTGNVYAYERYQRASREERGQHLFASSCYGCFEEGVRDLSPAVQAECSANWSRLLPGIITSDDELKRAEAHAVSTVREIVSKMLREIEIACALQIVEYLKRHDGYIDSWPEAKIHVPVDEVSLGQDYLDPAAGAIAAAVNDYLRDEVYFTFTFPSAEEAIPKVAEELQLEREQRALEARIPRLHVPSLLVSYVFLPAGLLALYIFLHGPGPSGNPFEDSSLLASLVGRFAALPQVVQILLAPICFVLLALPALMALVFYGIYQHVSPTLGLVVGGIMDALATLGILYGTREALRRRATVDAHHRAINGLEHNESVAMARRERAEYRFVVQQLAHKMRT